VDRRPPVSHLPLAPPEPRIETDLNLLQPEMAMLATALILKCAHYGVGLRVTESLRTSARQDWLYNANRTFEHPAATLARTTYEKARNEKQPGLESLYKAWERAKRTRTNAPAGRSKHEQGLAIDVVPMSPWGVRADYDSPLWKQISNIGKGLGLVWGGDWPKQHDNPHFELKS
jgi:hypothetical protein